VESFIAILRESLSAIREHRYFESERGYQGALIAELQARLTGIGLPGDPIIEQEYQKTIPEHGITIRPDLIVHIPFGRKTVRSRADGNFVAMEIKRRATRVQAIEDFGSLGVMKAKLHYPLTIFLNLDSSETHATQCPKDIAAQTICIAVRLVEEDPVVVLDKCD
jgi:hypothetical protein